MLRQQSISFTRSLARCASKKPVDNFPSTKMIFTPKKKKTKQTDAFPFNVIRNMMGSGYVGLATLSVEIRWGDEERHFSDGATSTMKTTTDASNEYEASSFYDNDIILLGDYMCGTSFLSQLTNSVSFMSVPKPASTRFQWSTQNINNTRRRWRDFCSLLLFVAAVVFFFCFCLSVYNATFRLNLHTMNKWICYGDRLRWTNQIKRAHEWWSAWER